MARDKLVVVTEGMMGGLRKHVVDLLVGLDKSSYDITFVYSTNRADGIAYSQLNELSSQGIRLVVGVITQINILYLPQFNIYKI